MTAVYRAGAATPRSVYKYPLLVTDEQDLDLPAGAEVLDVQIQRGKLCLWALVDPRETRTVTRHFRVAGTGHPLEEAWALRHLGTVQMADGALVFHVFERAAALTAAHTPGAP